MRKFFLFLLAISAIAVCEAKSKKTTVTTENRKTAAFKRISMSGPIDVIYTQGKTCSVKVTSSAEQMKDVKTGVKDGTLFISYEGQNCISFTANGIGNLFRAIGGRGSGYEGITVYVTSPDIIEINLTGSGDFVSRNRIDTDKLTLRLRGSGDMTISDIICDEIDTELVGSGDIRLPRTDVLRSRISLVGSGDISTGQSNTRHTEISLKGSGDINVSFAGDKCGTANASLYGSGDITLSGRLKSLKKTSRGSGDFHTGKLTEK